jgi:tRNA U54 and U55 pseudouridine synthase Pus10
MKRISTLLLLTITIIVFQSCTKSDDNKKQCWKCTTTKQQTSTVERVCDKTASEISAYVMEGIKIGTQIPSKTDCKAD